MSIGRNDDKEKEAADDRDFREMLGISREVVRAVERRFAMKMMMENGPHNPGAKMPKSRLCRFAGATTEAILPLLVISSIAFSFIIGRSSAVCP